MGVINLSRPKKQIKAKPLSFSVSPEDEVKLNFILQSLNMNKTKFLRKIINDYYASLYTTQKRELENG